MLLTSDRKDSPDAHFPTRTFRERQVKIKVSLCGSTVSETETHTFLKHSNRRKESDLSQFGGKCQAHTP